MGLGLWRHSLDLLEHLLVAEPLFRDVIALEVLGKNGLLVECRSAVHILLEQLLDNLFSVLYHWWFRCFISSNNVWRALASSVLTDVGSMPSSVAISS